MTRPDAFDAAVEQGWQIVKQLDALLLASAFDTDAEVDRVSEEACRLANIAQYDLQTVSGSGSTDAGRPHPWSDETKKQWLVYGEINESLLRVGRRMNLYYANRDAARRHAESQELHALATHYYTKAS